MIENEDLNESEVDEVDEINVSELNRSPAEHYGEAVVMLEMAGRITVEDSLYRTNMVLEALTHAFLGGLRSELDYQARQDLERVAKEAEKRGYSLGIEEAEDDRP